MVTCFHGLVSRVLESGVLAQLVSTHDLSVVLLVPDFKVDYFLKVFKKYSGVHVEGIHHNVLPRQTQWFQRLSFLLLATGTMSIIRRSHRGYPRRYQQVIAELIARLFGRRRVVRRLFRYLNRHFSGSSQLGDYFERYKPALLFSTDIKSPLDTAFLIEAKRRGIKTVGMVRSWDYLTAKGIVRVLPEKVIVHNDIIKEEAIRYMDMKAPDIVVVGMPHFDPYQNYPRSRREDFYKRIGAHLAKRLVLLAPEGDKFTDTDAEVFNLLCEAIKEGKLPRDLAFLVRVPPGDTVNLQNFHRCADILFDYPGVSFTGNSRKENEMSLRDLLHLADSLFHSSLVISGTSTIAIDAAAFDKPVIFRAFEGREKKGYYQGFVHGFDFDHMQRVVQTGGVVMAKSSEELIKLINHALSYPADHRTARARIVLEQCGAQDGQASARLAAALRSFV